jgi:hypothetical protein
MGLDHEDATPDRVRLQARMLLNSITKHLVLPINA